MLAVGVSLGIGLQWRGRRWIACVVFHLGSIAAQSFRTVTRLCWRSRLNIRILMSLQPKSRIDKGFSWWDQLFYFMFELLGFRYISSSVGDVLIVLRSWVHWLAPLGVWRTDRRAEETEGCPGGLLNTKGLLQCLHVSTWLLWHPLLFLFRPLLLRIPYQHLRFIWFEIVWMVMSRLHPSKSSWNSMKLLKLFDMWTLECHQVRNTMNVHVWKCEVKWNVIGCLQHVRQLKKS